MEPIIKVCGIRSPKEAQLAVRVGANTLGFIVHMLQGSRDEISCTEARRIVRSVPSTVRTVLVTDATDIAVILRMAKLIGPTAIQLQGDVPEEAVRVLKEMEPEIELIKVLHVPQPGLLAKAISYANTVDMLLLDSYKSKILGAPSEIHDWAVSAEVISSVPVPVILAGGLTPANVEQAIHKAQPSGVDSNSGLRHKDGSKDPEKVRRFAEFARVALKKSDGVASSGGTSIE